MSNPNSYRTLPSVVQEESVADPNMYAPENRNPRGANTNPLVFNFQERLRYRNANYFKDLPTPIDTWYDKVFYGKVDRYQNSIVPKKDSSLIAQTSYEQNAFALDFVAAAFFKLKRNLTIAGDSGAIDKDTSVLYNLQAQGGWFNYERSYQNFLERLTRAQYSYLLSLDKKDLNKIITFRDYLGALQNYLKQGDYRAPISLTEFVLHPATPPSISGLTIEMAGDSYAEDLNKYRKYFLDPNFSYYVRAARKFGFYVDRNGPWRLFADVFSPPMAGLDGFIGAANHVNGDIQKNFFNSYYDRTYTLDVTLLQEGLRAGYNRFVQDNPKITESTPGLTKKGFTGAGVGTVACGAPAGIKILGYRTGATAEMVEGLGDSFWLDFYFNIRMHESGIFYNNAAILIQEAIKISGAYDYNQALIYINNLFKPYLYDERIFKKHLTQADQTVRVGSVLDAPTTVVGSGGGY